MSSELMDYLSEKVITDLRLGNHISTEALKEFNKYDVIDYFRKKIGVSDLNMILDLLNSKESELFYFGISLSKNIVEQEPIKKKLFNIWENAISNYKTKREVMWRILDIPNLSIKIHESIYSFIITNWDNWANDTLIFYGGPQNVLDAIINRSKDPLFIEDKHWVYICLATLSPKKERAKQYISKYLQSKNVMNSKVANEMIKKLNTKSI